MPDRPANGEKWILRTVVAALFSFMVGNGTSYLLFGLHTASRKDVADLGVSIDKRITTLEGKVDALETAENQMAGVLRAKGIDPPATQR